LGARRLARCSHDRIQLGGVSSVRQTYLRDIRRVLTAMTGAIFGTGTNGAYVEEVAKITKLGNSPAAALGGQMIVNTEWGAFNNTVCILQFFSCQSI
jgi:hexokinase